MKWIEKIVNGTSCKCDLPFRCWYTTLVLQEALIWEKYSLHPVYHLLCSWKQLFLYHHGWTLLDCRDCISRLVWNREGRAPMRSKNIRTKIVNCIYFQNTNILLIITIWSISTWILPVSLTVLNLGPSELASQVKSPEVWRDISRKVTNLSLLIALWNQNIVPISWQYLYSIVWQFKCKRDIV